MGTGEIDLTSLAHISDLHFGSADQDAVTALEQMLNDLSPDLVVVTGDLTQSGRHREFAAAAQFLAGLDAPKLVIPGNHDVSVWNPLSRFITPWRRFNRSVGDDLNPVHEDEASLVMGLNSARRAGPYSDWSRGRLSRRQISNVQQRLQTSDAGLKAVALHHPLEVAGGKAGAKTVSRAEEALSVFVGGRIDLALTGHVHQSAASTISRENWQFVVSKAGTATSTRTRGEAASINLIEADTDEMSVRILHHTSTGFEESSHTQFHKKETGWQQAA